MPTPVSVARQCLTPEAAHALDEAVAVARRRGHAQTTSLHAVSALLSLPSSTLRDACARARNCAYSHRLQFKALELCLSVSLDRITSSSSSSQQSDDDPPVSNSLMAAIKRSQANQRRQPENFHLYHHQLAQSTSSSVTVIKVELQHLIISILDDPVVSRVFSESGFRSSEIKLAILRPLASQLFKFSRSKAPPPIFLCNYLNENFDPGSGRRRLSSSFPGFGGFLDNEDENCRRISDVLLQRKNPLLVGIHASAALKIFHENIVNKNENNNSNDTYKNNSNGLGPGLGSGLSVQLSGLDIISIEAVVSKFVSGECDKGIVKKKFEEVDVSIKRNLGPGVVVNYGDLKVFVNNSNCNNDDDDDDNNGSGNSETSDPVSHVVVQLTRLLQLHGGKVWLIGAAATYETYLKFVSRFSSIEKDWDLQLLPITSLRPSSMADSCHRSSLMESFVPFGGFFSTSSDLKTPLCSLYQSVSRCQQCNDKCEQEIIASSKGGFTASIADQCQSVLPSWLQMAEPDSNKGLHPKTKDDGLALRSKITKKWDDICQSLHRTQSLPSSDNYQVGSQFPTVVGFQFLQDKKENADNSSSSTNAPVHGGSYVNVYSGIPIDSENLSASRSVFPFHTVSKAKNDSLLSKLWEKPSKADLDSGGNRSPCCLSSSSVEAGTRKSPTPVTSVTTDLGLGLLGIGSAPASNEPKESTSKDFAERSQELSGCCSATVNGSISNQPAQSSSSSCPDLNCQFDLSNWKTLFTALTEKIDWQDEALGVISQTIAQRRTGHEDHHGASPRRDIWFNFAGPDQCGKRKIAFALAEIIYGGKENFICADLCPQDGVMNNHTIFYHQDVCGNSVQFRGKTVADYVAWELLKKPLSVVYLENVDKSDVHVQNSLSKAIQTGKLSDSYGREVSVSNAIFVTTSSFVEDARILPSEMKDCKFSEERIYRAKSRLMQILIEPALVNRSISQKLSASETSEGMFHQKQQNKRKLIGRNDNPQQDDTSEMVKRAHRSPTRNLDLNLPAEEDEVLVLDSDDDRNSDSSENTKSWLQDFFNQRVKTVAFKAFNFDALAEKILKDINASFCKIVGSEYLLEIDRKVMEQLLAAAYLSESDRVIEDWLEKVLVRGFLDVQEKYNLTANSIVKLVACESHFLEELTPGVCLPPKLVLN